jgi:hypothetical protein
VYTFHNFAFTFTFPFQPFTYVHISVYQCKHDHIIRYYGCRIRKWNFFSADETTGQIEDAEGKWVEPDRLSWASYSDEGVVGDLGASAQYFGGTKEGDLGMDLDFPTYLTKLI